VVVSCDVKIPFDKTQVLRSIPYVIGEQDLDFTFPKISHPAAFEECGPILYSIESEPELPENTVSVTS
jgi:hypothetical protein